jgi:hypothetical protein
MNGKLTIRFAFQLARCGDGDGSGGGLSSAITSSEPDSTSGNDL